MPEPVPPGPFDQGLFLTHFNKGRELFQAHRLDEAERELEEAYLLRPRDVRVLNLLGLVYFRQDKLAKAEEVYRKLIAENPEAHTLHYNLGLICLKLDRLQDAESAFLKALDLRGNPKIHFYLASIYERSQRFKDAIHHYRQAGANLMVQRVEDKMVGAAGSDDDSASAERPDTRPPGPLSEEEAAVVTSKVVLPVSPSLMSEDAPPETFSETARFQVFDDTLPPGSRRAPKPPVTPPAPPPEETEVSGQEVFRCVERGLMEVDFSGKVFIKLGSIYSYSGNLTFWVKEKRPEGQPTLVIVTGTGRLILTDREREITLMQVGGEAVFVEPSRLLACEEALQPHYERLGDARAGVEVVVLEGKGMVALSVSTKPLPLTVQPNMPASIPASSLIMWTGEIAPSIVDDPTVYEIVMPSASSDAKLLRLEGTGRVLVEQGR
jgi:tetratricopeptide (TPR) repeat protein